MAAEYIAQLRALPSVASPAAMVPALTTSTSTPSITDEPDIELRLKESLRQKLRALPRHIRSVNSDDLTKRTALRLVLSHLRQLHAEQPRSLAALLHVSMDDVGMTLFHVFALDSQDNRIVEPSLPAQVLPTTFSLECVCLFLLRLYIDGECGVYVCLCMNTCERV